MKREHKENKSVIVPDPVYWFPLTADANDVMGNWIGWSTISGVTYSSNGAYFNGSQKIEKTNASISHANFHTFSVEVMFPQLYATGLYCMFKYACTRYNTFNAFNYAPGWSQDLNCATYYNNSYGVLSISSVPFVANQFYTLLVRYNYDTGMSELFIDGVLRNSATKVIPASETVNNVYIGVNNGTDRYFKGYIRNVRMWNVMLTDEQISML